MNARRFAIPKLAVLALVAGSVALPWSTAPAVVDDDREERHALARQSFVENCLMCHGEDMTTRQRLTTRQWTAEVEKMANWGAPLPLDRKQPLIDYLAEVYPETRPAPPLDRVDPDGAFGPDRQDPPSPLEGADLVRGEALFGAQCAACHGAGARGGELGTNLVEKPVLLREDEFRVLMRDGRRRMPGFAAVLDGNGPADLLAWLRLRR